MPIVNVYIPKQDELHAVHLYIGEIKSQIAADLTCAARSLQPQEISVRIIEVTPTSGVAGMIAPLEVEIKAHEYPARVDNQDRICANIRSFLLKKLRCSDVRVWLQLSQLGHSWE